MIEKQPIQRGRNVKVKFELPADAAQKSVAVVGDFNDWDKGKHPMKLDKKKGVWTTAINLPAQNRYQFRYFVDESEWRNDDQADGYESNPFFSENSVLDV